MRVNLLLVKLLWRLKKNERAGFLREICGADLELRDEVESLLKASDEPELLIEKEIITTSPEKLLNNQSHIECLFPSLESALISTGMTKEEWKEVNEIVLDALELDVDQRQEFIEKRCADSPEMKREAESLLIGELRAKKFFESPAIVNYASFFNKKEEPDALVGQQFGHYRIIREIGAGGMGAVFLAERADGEFNQQVALKIVRRSFADLGLSRRFRQERQILAKLNHPNIALKIYG